MTNRHNLYLRKVLDKNTITCGRCYVQTKGIGVAMNSVTPSLFDQLPQAFSWLTPPQKSPETSRYERPKTASTAGLGRRRWGGDVAFLESGSCKTCFLAR